ncbi:MAG TPA: glycosyltransferase [Desulfomonilaceae bacterium]|nr:glycosyltransferase [Desulfomonilaceae bacterium]
MRILVLTTSYPSDEHDPSGIFIASLLKAMQRRGHVVKVIAPSNGLFHGERVVDGVPTLRFSYFLPRSLERLTRGLGGIPENMSQSVLARIQIVPMMSAFLFSTLFQARKFDVIYANWLGAGLIGAIGTLWSAKPLIVSFRGDDGYLARDRPLWRVLTKWVIRRADALAPVSRELNDIIVALGTPPEKCFLPRFGVDPDLFRPRSAPKRTGDEIRIMYAGAMLPKKGVRDLLEAVAADELREVRLVLVGDGFYRPDLVDFAERAGLTDRVEWKGLQPHAEVAKEMQDADIFCLPSYTEGRPNVVNEAMASGLPVVTTRIGGIPDMVEEGRTALLYNPGDIEGLRNCLKTLVDHADLRRTMGAKGRDLILESNRSWDTSAEDFEKMFEAIAKKI